RAARRTSPLDRPGAETSRVHTRGVGAGRAPARVGVTEVSRRGARQRRTACRRVAIHATIRWLYDVAELSAIRNPDDTCYRHVSPVIALAAVGWRSGQAR